jgi:hypothetical protein
MSKGEGTISNESGRNHRKRAKKIHEVSWDEEDTNKLIEVNSSQVQPHHGVHQAVIHTGWFSALRSTQHGGTWQPHNVTFLHRDPS